MEKLKAAALTGRTLVMKCPPEAFLETSPFIRMTIHGECTTWYIQLAMYFPMTTETSMWLFYDKSLFVFNAKYQTKYHGHIGVFIEYLLTVPTALMTDPESAHIKKLLSKL